MKCAETDAMEVRGDKLDGLSKNHARRRDLFHRSHDEQCDGFRMMFGDRRDSTSEIHEYRHDGFRKNPARKNTHMCLKK